MKAVVCAPACPLSARPGPGQTLADEALFGMVLEVLEVCGPGWGRVRTPYRYEGYAPLACLVTGEENVRQWADQPKRVVRHKNSCDVMCVPSVRARPWLTLPLGALVATVGEAAQGWQKVALPGGGEGYVRASALASVPPAPAGLAETDLRSRLAEAAMAYRGTQYRWGGKTPQGIDCSGMVSMAYLLNGITIYRDAELRPGFDLVEISREEADVGDLLFFPGHVALYLGAGRYVHATGQAGSDGVWVNSLQEDAPNYRPDLAQTLTRVGSYKGFHGCSLTRLDRLQ